MSFIVFKTKYTEGLNQPAFVPQGIGTSGSGTNVTTFTEKNV